MRKRQDIQKHYLKKLACGVIAAAFCVSASFALPAYAVDSAAKAELEQRLKDAQNEIDRLSGEKANTEEYLVALAAKLDLLQQRIDALQAEIGEKQQAISQLEAQIKEKEAAIADLELQIAEQQKLFDVKKEQYNERLRILYMSGSVSNLEALLTSDDVGTLLTRAQLISSVSQKDQQALEDLVKSMEDIKKRQAELEESKKVLNDSKVDLLASKSALDDSKAQLEREKAQMVADREKNEQAVKNFQANLGTQQKVAKDTQDELDLVAAQIAADKAELPDDAFSGGSNNSGSGDTPTPPDNSGNSGGSDSGNSGNNGGSSSQGNYRFTHPCPGRVYISVGFPRYSDGDWHGGVDFACLKTSPPIYAADDGIVITARDLGDRSYGKYIVIYHEPGLYTLYGHCSELYVNKGDRVTKGQTIAKVGSTGKSTGNHLHFEVRLGDGESNQDGYVADPAKYVKDALLY